MIHSSLQSLIMTLHPLSLSLLLLLFTATHTNAQPSPAPGSTPVPVPVVVADAAVARTATKLYIQGGNSSIGDVEQFFSLDLAVPWTTANPAWTKLAFGSTQHSFPAAFSADGQTMITFRTGGSSYAMRYSVSNDTWSPSRINPLHGAMHGITPVTDPTTGLVYLAAGYTGIRSEMSIYDFEKDTIYSGQPLPDPSQIFEARAYYRAVWSKKRESILYFGGYNTMLKTVDHANTVSEFVPKTLTWQVMPTTGEIPTMRADHCMASNDDGTLVIVYGGRVNASPTTFSGELFILDTDKRTWKKGLTGPSRIYSACTVAGDQFIIWGGLNGDYQSAEKPMLIYNLTKDEWVDAYTPPTAYTDKSTKSDTAAGSSSITGAIIGGTVGCLAIIIIFALAWVFLRRRQNTIRGSLINSQDDDEYGNTNRNSHYASTSFEADRSPGLRGLAHQDRDHEQEALELRQGLLLQNHPPVGSYRPQTTYVPSRRSGEARRSVMNDAPPSGKMGIVTSDLVSQPIYKAQPYVMESMSGLPDDIAPGFAYGSPYNSGMTPSAKN